MIHELGNVPYSNRKELWEAIEKRRLLKTEKGQEREIISKECIVSGKVSFLMRMDRVCWAYYLTSVTR